MAGDPLKASLWSAADVYVGALTATDPTNIDTSWGSDWDLVGLLDGDAGFTHSRSEDETDHFAWGGILVRTGRKNFKETVKFTALEDNDTVRGLIWPGSSNLALYVPSPTPIKLGLELREDDKMVRYITKYYCEITVDGDYTENESDLTKYPLIATVTPDGNGQLYVRQAQSSTGVNDS